MARANSEELRGSIGSSTPTLARAESTGTASSSMKSFVGGGADGGTLGEESELEVVLFKVPIEDVVWTRVNIDLAATPNIARASSAQLLECHAGRALALRTLERVAVSPDRNVAAILDESGKLVVLDLAEDD